MDKAYFPYGSKTKEFLIKRTLYFCKYLKLLGVDYIVLACNTLSYLVLPFIKLIYDNVYGVFSELEDYIDDRSVIIGSRVLVKELKLYYPNCLYVDGTEFIKSIEEEKSYQAEAIKLKKLCIGRSNLILACTHFMSVDFDFKIETIKNNSFKMIDKFSL